MKVKVKFVGGFKYLKKRRRKTLRFSKSSLSQYMDCPRRYYYDRNPEIPKRTDHPRLAGQVVHEMVQNLYRATKDPRPFYYKRKRGFLGYFWYRWQEELTRAKNEGELQVNDPELEKKFHAVGAKCLSNYWDANINQPRPVEIEKTYRFKLKEYPLFIGIFDQVREVSIPWIKKHRPELVVGDTLIPGYSPRIIVDLKTEWASFDVEKTRKQPSLGEMVRFLLDMHADDEETFEKVISDDREETLYKLFYELGDRERPALTLEHVLRKQFKLHEDIQVTLYTLLHELVKGTKPIAFCWYHLPSNKWFPTWREDADYQTLYGIAAHVRDNIAANSYPKNIGRHCSSCDHVVYCREDRSIMLSRPEDPGEDPGHNVELAPNIIEKDPAKQLSMKLGIRRKKQIKPPIIPPPPDKPPLRDLPWDGETQLSLPSIEKEEEK